MRITVVSGEPRPGYEFEYYLALKHRHIASEWMLKLMKRPWAFSANRRADRLWHHAMDRFHRYGQNRTYSV